MKSHEKIKKIRTVYMPNFLGTRISQTQFGMVVSKVAKHIENADMFVSHPTVQSWESGRYGPNPVAAKAIDYILEKTYVKSNKEIDCDELPYLKRGWGDADIEDIVQKITS